MRRVWLLMLLFAPLARTQAQLNIGRRSTPDIAVRLVGPFQSLRVTAWSRDSVSLTGFLGPGYRMDNVFSGDPNVAAGGAKLYIEGPPQGMAKSAVLELRVPAGARVWIKGGTGSVAVIGVTGDVDVNMIGGTVQVTGNARTVNVEAMDASVNIDGHPDWVRLKTAAGDIVMRGGSPDAAFTSISGGVRVGEGVYERARFETVTGNLYFTGDLARAASLTFDTHSGAVELQLLAKSSPGFVVEATTLAGAIENTVSAARPNTGRDGRGQELSLEVGVAGGGGRVVVGTYKGNIKVAPRGG